MSETLNVVLDDTAMTAVGRGNVLASRLIHRAHAEAAWFLYAPACALVEADRARPGAAEHLATLPGVTVLDLDLAATLALARQETWAAAAHNRHTAQPNFLLPVRAGARPCQADAPARLGRPQHPRRCLAAARRSTHGGTPALGLPGVSHSDLPGRHGRRPAWPLESRSQPLMDDRGLNGRLIADGKFVVPHGDGLVPLEAVDAALDCMALAVVGLVELRWSSARTWKRSSAPRWSIEFHVLGRGRDAVHRIWCRYSRPRPPNPPCGLAP